MNFKENCSDTWLLRDDKIYFVKCEGQKNSFCEMWETMDWIMWNVRNYGSDYVKCDLTILSLKNDHV